MSENKAGNNNQNRLDFGDDATIGRDVIGGDSNVVTFNHTEILQISEKEITSRELLTTSPYKGLKSFESRDKELFFGRDNFISTLVNELEQTNLILLLGASGSGKSSVVRAGLIPWLENKHGTGFTNLTFTPDADPFDSFYASLRGNYSQAEAKIAREVKAETLIQVVNNLKKADEFWFIFVDQFEELFTTTSDKNKRQEFINGLMKLSQAKLPNVVIMATMRADFLERLSDYPQMVEATQKHRPMIVGMQSSELRFAIEQPAAHHGIVFEAKLVDKIIAEIQGQAGYLPLLQYTLNLVWDDEVKTGSINDRTLNMSTYQKLGGVQGALQKHVNSIYKKLSPSEQLAAQRIFLKLVGIGENAESGIEWKPFRKRAQLSEFGDDERDVLLKLVNENLLVSDADLSATESKKGLFGSSKPGKSRKYHSTIEITHEILLTSWDKLHRWIQKNRQGIALRNRLYEDVKRWQTNKPEDELWTGSKLEQVLELKKDNNFNQVLGRFNTEANQFIEQSVRLRDRQLRRTRIVAFTVAGLASLASVIALGALYQLEVSSLQEKAARAQNLLSSNSPMDGLILAIQATGESQGGLRRVLPQRRRVLPQIRRVLPNAIDIVRERNILQGHDGWVISVAVSPDGEYIATGNDDSTVRLWSIEGKFPHTLEGHEGEGDKGWVNSVAFSPDGKYIVSGGADTTVRLWSIEGGRLLKTFKLKSSVNSVSFSPSSDRIITGSSGGTVQLWLTEGQLLRTFRGHQGSVRSVAFSSDGQYIVSGGRDSTVRLWTVEGELLKTFTGHYWGVESVNLSPNYEPESGFIISGGRDRTLKLWSYEDDLLATKEHEAGVTSVSFSQDGEYIVSSSFDSSSRLWTIENGLNLVELADFRGHEGDVNSVAITPNNKLLISGGKDGTVRVWSRQGQPSQLLKKIEDEAGLINSVVFSPDGQYIASGNSNSTIRIWTTQGNALPILKGHKKWVSSVTFSPDSEYIISGSYDNTIRFWSIKGELFKTLDQPDKVLSLAISSDGKYIASGSVDGKIRLWSVAGQGQSLQTHLLQTMEGHEGGVYSVAFSPDGQHIVSGGEDSKVRLWSVAEQGQLLQPMEGHEGRVYSVAFSPDGQHIVSGGEDSKVWVWSLEGEKLNILKGHQGRVFSVAFSPDGQHIVSSGRDKTVRLWSFKADRANNSQLLAVLKGHFGEVQSAVFSPDGKYIASGGQANELRLWSQTKAKEWLQVACNNLKAHPIFQESTQVTRNAKNICTRYVW